MKYQIYLNKETSEIINAAAQEENMKPSTMIKQILESMIKISKATAEEVNQELKEHGTRKPKK